MSTSRLRLHIAPTAEWKLRAGHPWLYADSIGYQNRPGETGELAILYDRHDNFLAIGLYDPDSPLRVRVLHQGKPQTVDAAWWRQRLHEALQRRTGLFDDQTTGYRWINGESDGWPGLVLDCYGGTLVLKIYTLAWLPLLPELCGWIVEALTPERVVLRLSRNIQAAAQARFKRADGDILFGNEPEGSVEFLESGLRFEAEVVRGQKTGFFLDQRENRRRVGALSAGRDVLNVFSFSGGFSLYAALGGARSATDLDMSPHALAAGRRHFALNANVGSIAQCRYEQVQADAFEWLAGSVSGAYDLIVLDPPSLAKREPERERAIQAYGRLSASALPRLRKSGILVAASCSAHVSEAEFFESVRRAVRGSGRSFQEIETTGHAPDHPASFAEAKYLKCIYLRVA